MKKFLIITVLQVALYTGLAPLLVAQEKSITIGAIIPLTGPMASHGVEIQNAMKLALDESSAETLNYRYNFIFEDNQLDGTKSISAAQKLLNINHVDAVITLWPPTANLVIPLTEKAKVLHYTIAWDPELAKKHKLVLSHQAMVSELARSTLSLLKKEQKTRVAFLHMEEAGFNLGARHVNELSLNMGTPLLVDDAFNPNETDFRSLIERTEAKSPDAYLLWGVSPSLDILIRQIKARNPKAYVTGYLDYTQELNLIQETPYISEMYASHNFSMNYSKRYHAAPISKGANAYDITNLLIKAYEGSPSKKLSATEVKSYLTKIKDYDGAVGTFSIDQYGNSSYSPVVRNVTGNKRKLVEN